jgi:hypothetical protein
MARGYTKTQEQVVEVFLEQNCTLVTGEYQDCYTKLGYICQCGQLGYIRMNGFKKGKRCGYCTRKTYLENLDQRRQYMFQSGIKFTPSLKFLCACGTEEFIPHIYDTRVFSTYICPSCDIRKTRHNSEYNNWKFAVRHRDDSACQCCKSVDKPQAHHIKSRQAYPELQYTVSNGIVLCFTRHMQLHMLYGNDTTEIELGLFLEKKLT